MNSGQIHPRQSKLFLDQKFLPNTKLLLEVNVYIVVHVYNLLFIKEKTNWPTPS